MERLLLFFILFYLKTFGQSATPQVVATGGGIESNTLFSNSFTIGETGIIETFTNGSFILTQGFHQPELRKQQLTDFFVPNGITPNGDGVNDVWEIPDLKNYPKCIVTVFNRWGQQLYKSVGYSQPWDGTFHGNELPPADYYYVISLGNGSSKEQTGTITLKR